MARHGQAGQGSARQCMVGPGSVWHGRAIQKRNKGKLCSLLQCRAVRSFLREVKMAAKAKEKAQLAKVSLQYVAIRLVGRTPLITHKWSEKAKEMMRAKQQDGKKTKTRELRIPKEECEAACYRTADGLCGVPAMAIKSSIVEAAHNDLGFPKTLVRKALFIYPPGRDCVIALEDPKTGKPIDYQMEEDMVTVGTSADFRYRPYYYDWACTTHWEVDIDLLQVEDLLTLVDRAGFGVGICEWRPEKGGEFGRFGVCSNTKTVVTPKPPTFAAKPKQRKGRTKKSSTLAS